MKTDLLLETRAKLTCIYVCIKLNKIFNILVACHCLFNVKISLYGCLKKLSDKIMYFLKLFANLSNIIN